MLKQSQSHRWNVKINASVARAIRARLADAHILINTHTPQTQGQAHRGADAATSHRKAIEQAAKPPEMRGVPNPSSRETPTTSHRQGGLINSIALTDNQLG